MRDSETYEESSLQETPVKRGYHKLSLEEFLFLFQEKQKLIEEVFVNNHTISKAAKMLKINNSTAKVVCRRHKQSKELNKTNT